ncbi:MAG: leucine-rich repeat protein [Bacteroidaceae bacterium]|nr:leucine-rich repeat protein [Bacteroidaceae bacterium]
MKKFALFFLSCFCLLQSCEKYDDSELRDNISDLQDRVSKLEAVCKELNTNVSALQTIVQALNSRDYVVNVSSIYREGTVVGYSITLFYGGTFTIYNGEDGVDGYVPNIGVAKDVDGVYYWTLDGKWLLDVNGDKIKASGTDGKDGVDGTDGKDGVDGTDGKDGVDGTDGKDGSDGNDGITPRLKIENNYWYISYNNGVDWEILGKATGNDGINGDNLFDSVTQDDTYVYFNLSDGTVITLPKQDKKNIQFEDLYAKMLCCNQWDEDGDGELSYAEAAKVTEVHLNNDDKIIAFTELKYFTNLSSLYMAACASLWKVELPEHLTKLDGGTFRACSKLKRISVPNNVTVIGGACFYDCGSLEVVTLGENIKEIGNQAFSTYYNRNILEIYLKAKTPPAIFASINAGQHAFYAPGADCPKIKIYVPRESYDLYTSYENIVNGETNVTNWAYYTNTQYGKSKYVEIIAYDY